MKCAASPPPALEALLRSIRSSSLFPRTQTAPPSIARIRPNPPFPFLRKKKNTSMHCAPFLLLFPFPPSFPFPGGGPRLFARCWAASRFMGDSASCLSFFPPPHGQRHSPSGTAFSPPLQGMGTRDSLSFPFRKRTSIT